jgi:hypothetical protein
MWNGKPDGKGRHACSFRNPHSEIRIRMGSGGMSEKMRTTYSMWSAFRNCRKACEWRYLKELVPLESDHNLAFGAVIHACLELWHRHRDLDRVLEHLDRTYASRCGDEKLLAEWHLATAMVKAYAARYPEEDFEIVALEKGFEEKIVNPATGAPERLRISDFGLTIAE